MSEIFNAELLAATIRMTAPLLLVALGGLMCQRAEIFNVGLEGCMLSGAFFTILFIYFTGSSLVGLLGGILGSVALSMVFALFVIKFHANHILTSLAINYTATGLTSFLLFPLYGVRGGFRPDNMETLLKLDIPLIKDIPFLGEVLSGHTITVYLAVILIFVAYFVLFKTPFGLQVRAVGINENAVRTAGVKPERIRFLACYAESRGRTYLRAMLRSLQKTLPPEEGLPPFLPLYLAARILFIAQWPACCLASQTQSAYGWNFRAWEFQLT